jgi:uncharacterized protein involved in response to NO
MLFGYSTAVVAGFLFTAVRNWTGLPTPTGKLLGAFALLWVAGRVLIFNGPATIAALVDVAFLPAVAIAIGIPILRSRNQRNYKVLAIVIALFVAHAMFHLASLGYVSSWLSRVAILTGIDILVILMAVVGGRIIPAFTRNHIADADPRHERWVELVAFGSLLLVTLLTALSGVWVLPPNVMTLLFVIVAASHATRLSLWEPLRTVKNPLLWMLPAGYSWIPFAMLLRAMAAQSIVPDSAGIHAITAGAVSSLMLAMMMRSALGHTGRRLVASGTDVTAFALLQIGAVVRVLASVIGGSSFRQIVIISGVIWTLAFVLFLSRYWPMLLRPRVDGRPG